MGINVGDLRHKIKILELQSIKDDYGSPTESYVEVMTLRAAVKEVSGNKQLDLKEKFNSRAIQFTTYFRPINETMRIEYQGKRFRILFITEVGLREGLNINAELINE